MNAIARRIQAHLPEVRAVAMSDGPAHVVAQARQLLDEIQDEPWYRQEAAMDRAMGINLTGSAVRVVGCRLELRPVASGSRCELPRETAPALAPGLAAQMDAAMGLARLPGVQASRTRLVLSPGGAR